MLQTLFQKSFSHLFSTESILVNKTQSTATITLNRPKALNALNLEMIDLMDQAVNDLEADPNIKAIFLEGAGDKSFCAGGDVIAVHDAGSLVDSDPLSRKSRNPDNLSRKFFFQEYKLDYKLSQLKTPLIAVMDGITMGGGVGISINAQYRICTPSTMFAMPETGIGLFCDVGGSWFLPRLKGELGTYLALSGDRVMGADNLAAGIATHFCSDTSQIDQIKSQIESSESVESILKKTLETTPKKNNSISIIQPWVDSTFSEDSIQAIMKNLETIAKNTKIPKGEWAKKTLKSFKRASPSSLCVVLEQMKRGSNLKNLSEAFEMEWIMSQNFMDGHDFYEGVRALLIDKDKSPIWDPPTIAKVTPTILNGYFEPNGNDSTLGLTQ